MRGNASSPSAGTLGAIHSSSFRPDRQCLCPRSASATGNQVPVITGPLLSTHLLDKLLKRWVHAGLPLVERLQPGLDEARLSELTQAVGLELPAEARLWWSWRNGTERAPEGGSADFRLMTPAFQFLSIEEAIESYVQSREIVRMVGESEVGPGELDAWVDSWWPPDLFPITKNAGTVVCDCRAPEATGTPIRWMEPSALHEGVPEPRARSFGELVTYWIDAWDSGIWTYRPTEGRWHRDESLVGPEKRLRML